MDYFSILESLPEELRGPLLRLVEALQQDLREQFAVRRSDFEQIQGTVGELAGGYERYEQRFNRLDTALARLAEAQEGTEQRVGRLETAMSELAEAQQRTEQRIEQLVEAQQQTEQRVGRLETAVAELAEAQKRTEQRVGRLETAVAELAEAQKRTEAALEALTIRVDSLTQDVGKLTQAVSELTRVVRRAKLDELRGFFLEHRYRERAHAYFGTVLRKVRVVAWDELEDQVDEGLPEQERKDLLLLDLLVRGRVRTRPDLPEVLVAVEISGQIDEYDVIRAQRRAAILRRLGYASVAAVAGEEMTSDGELSAQAANVAVVQNGTIRFWEEALAQGPH